MSQLHLLFCTLSIALHTRTLFLIFPYPLPYPTPPCTTLYYTTPPHITLSYITPYYTSPHHTNPHHTTLTHTSPQHTTHTASQRCKGADRDPSRDGWLFILETSERSYSILKVSTHMYMHMHMYTYTSMFTSVLTIRHMSASLSVSLLLYISTLPFLLYFLSQSFFAHLSLPFPGILWFKLWLIHFILIINFCLFLAEGEHLFVAAPDPPRLPQATFTPCR